MSIELLLDRSVNRISSERKVKRSLGTSNRWSHIYPKTCFQGRLGNVLKTPWGCPETTSRGRLLDVRLGRPQDVISRRPQDVRSGRPQDVSWGHPQDGQIGSLEDVLGTLEGDVLRTSWGSTFASSSIIDVSLGSEFVSDYLEAFSIIINWRFHFESFMNVSNLISILLKYLEQKFSRWVQ